MFERSWAQREEQVYKSLFKNFPTGIYTPEDSTLVAMGGEILKRSHAGVFEVPPSPELPYWTYITSGLSNPLSEEP